MNMNRQSLFFDTLTAYKIIFLWLSYLLDTVLICVFFAITLFIGVYVSKKSAKILWSFFSWKKHAMVAAGISMVATTFSTDTPNLVTNIVRNDGVAGNWTWWAFLITGLLTVFVYAKLWRRSGVQTDIEFANFDMLVSRNF